MFLWLLIFDHQQPQLGLKNPAVLLDHLLLQGVEQGSNAQWLLIGIPAITELFPPVLCTKFFTLTFH
jgi:hypothetical protein